MKIPIEIDDSFQVSPVPLHLGRGLNLCIAVTPGKALKLEGEIRAQNKPLIFVKNG